MNGRLPWYKHLFCDCGGIIRAKDYYTGVCDDCGKEIDLSPLDYQRILYNEKTGWMFPVVDREDADFSQIKRIVNGENITTTFHDMKEDLTTT